MMVVIVVMTMSVGGRPVRMMLHHRMVVLNPSIITPLIMLVIIGVLWATPHIRMRVPGRTRSWTADRNKIHSGP